MVNIIKEKKLKILPTELAGSVNVPIFWREIAVLHKCILLTVLSGLAYTITATTVAERRKSPSEVRLIFQTSDSMLPVCRVDTNGIYLEGLCKV